MRRGFTLIEVLVVIALFGVMLIFAIPALYQMLQTYYVKMAASQMAIHIRMARNLAVSQKVNYHMTINSKDSGTIPNTYSVLFESYTGTYLDVPRLETDIPEAVQILSTSIFTGGAATLEFDSRGRITSTTGASPYTIDIQGANDRTYRLTVDKIGSVQIDEV